jgi:hypothetical protein
LTDAGLMDFRVAVAGSADAAITWNTALAINNNGQVGIGTDYTGSGLLRVGRAPSAADGGQRTIFADGTHDAITATGTNYLHNVWIQNNNFDIDSGVTDSGYRIGLNIEGYHDNSNLAGTLATQKNVWSRNGNNSGGTGTITNSYNMHLETLSGGGITITNNYGLYQTGAGTKNYFEGNLMVGSTTPGDLSGNEAMLTVRRDTGNAGISYQCGPAPTDQWETYANLSARYYIENVSTSNGAYLVYNSGSGWTSVSDERWKTDWTLLEDSSSKITALNIGKYHMLNDSKESIEGARWDYGVKAQELLEVIPDAVDVPETPEDKYGVVPNIVFWHTVKALQEAIDKIESLEQRLNDAGL